MPRIFNSNVSSDEQVDRILAYSVPDEKYGQMVYFYLCTLEQTVMSVRGAYCCLNIKTLDSKNVIASFIRDDKLIQGRIELPLDIDNVLPDDKLPDGVEQIVPIGPENKPIEAVETAPINLDSEKPADEADKLAEPAPENADKTAETADQTKEGAPSPLNEID